MVFKASEVTFEAILIYYYVRYQGQPKSRYSGIRIYVENMKRGCKAGIRPNGLFN